MMPGRVMPTLGKWLFLLCLGGFAEVDSRPTDSKHAEFGLLYTGRVNRNVEELYTYNYTSKLGKVDALHVFVNSDADNLQFPVLFVVRQQKGVLSWQVPLLFRGYSNKRTYTYHEVSRTLCPKESEGEIEKFIYIEVASMAPYDVVYQLMVTRLHNFELETGVMFNFSASPSQPQYFLYRLPENVDSVIIKVQSPEAFPCSVVSVQDVACPVYDMDYNVEFNGIYQTMTKKAAITVRRKDFPSGQFYVVFVIKPEDYACGGSVPIATIGKGNHTWNLKRIKDIQVIISPSIKDSVYIQATLLSLLFFLIFYLGSLLVAFVHYVRIQRKGLDLQDSPSDGEGTVSMSHPITTSTPEGSSYGAIDESSPGTGKIPPPAAIPRPRMYSDSSADEDSDFEALPEMEGDKNVIRAKTFLYVSDLSVKDRRIISKKYKIYFWNISTIAVFYALPVVQLVITYQTVVNITGNQDICYYNFLCAHPLGVLSAFNNVMSNMGHMLLGILFLLIVLRRDLLHRHLLDTKNSCALDYGIPKHFGLFYTMGIALVMEGVLSACYHVCPNYSNFQFDTSFMYMIAGLCMLKLYQTRHPDINASAYSAYASFALIIFLAVLGVVFGKNNIWFWVIFSIIHILGSLALSTHIYYMGRFRIDFGIFRRIGQVLYTDCIQQCSRPIYMDRMILLIVGNLVNWFFAIFGLVYRPRDFASYLLGIFICNLLLYLAFYIIMKLRSSEKIQPLPLFCIVATAVVWAAALYFFFQNLSSWEVLLTLDDDLDAVRRDKIPVF
ncbi:SID1 transmembrane family member 1 isoform X2 [Bombina bombina]|uniref:SID1 transmembrane family member 1 isoform X2 n=1 Tax=Bombina bombina TaxID=8345 RepID=UPI00235AD77C|nr:SID1 transmembrane family member 1 isoform X2 [Bombina bombina]